MPSKDEICTYTHRYMNPLDAKPADIVIEDIAHALSLMTGPMDISRSFIRWDSTVSAVMMKQRPEDTVID